MSSSVLKLTFEKYINNKNSTTNKNIYNMEKNLFSDEDFPTLSSKGIRHSHIPFNSKSFKNVVEESKVSFNFDILEKTPDETLISYYNRLLAHFKSSTLTHTYKIFICTKGVKSYKVAARHEIIAKLLCQMYENKYLSNDKSKDFADFKIEAYNRLEHDEIFYSDLLDLVEDDKTKLGKAIKIYYDNINKNKRIVNISWILSSKCVETGETILSEERILN